LKKEIVLQSDAQKAHAAQAQETAKIMSSKYAVCQQEIAKIEVLLPKLLHI
jgi:hypothetical protein